MALGVEPHFLLWNRKRKKRKTSVVPLAWEQLLQEPQQVVQQLLLWQEEAHLPQLLRMPWVLLAVLLEEEWLLV